MRIVTGCHNGSGFPRIIADHGNQHQWLVDALLHDSGHAQTLFYVWHKPVIRLDPHQEWPHEWLRIGYHGQFGAAFFYDDSTPPDDDWAWIAVNPEPLAEPPTIFYDAATPVIFPPVAVMPLGRLREVILEWCQTGLRPTCVEWMPVNSQVWDLDQDGTVLPEPPQPRRTLHYLTGRGELVREYGWGTDRTAPEPSEPQPELTYADHRTGRTAFGTAGPEGDNGSAS